MRINVVATIRVGAVLAGGGMMLPWLVVSPSGAIPQATLTGLDLASGRSYWRRPELYLILLCATLILLLAHKVPHVAKIWFIALVTSVLALGSSILFMAQGFSFRFGDGFVSLYSGTEGLVIGPGSYLSMIGCLVMAGGILLSGVQLNADRR